MDLKDKTVLITGKWDKRATHALAWAVAQRGAHVVLVNKASDATEPITREIRNGGKKAVVIQADVQSEAELARMTHQTLAAFGRIDILIHHLGHFRSFTASSSARAASPAWLKEQLRCQQAVMPTLLRQQSGTVINVGKVRRRAAGPQSLSALMTRIQGRCLQVQTIGPFVQDGADTGPALKKRLGEAMGLAEHPCLQVQHRPDLPESAAQADPLIGFLMGLLGDEDRGHRSAAQGQK